MTDERLPHIAILAKPMIIKKGDKLPLPLHPTCSYCGVTFEAVSTMGNVAENLVTAEQTHAITGFSSYFEECPERIKQERAI